LKRAAIGLVPDFHQSEYTENPAGEGFVNDVHESEWIDED
jgi:hypothetical protein